MMIKMRVTAVITVTRILFMVRKFDIAGGCGDMAGSGAGDLRGGDMAGVGFCEVGFWGQKMDGHIAGGGFDDGAVTVAAVHSHIAGGSFNM